MVSANEKERIRLLEADLTQTNDFIKGVISTSAALRGSAITIWLALMGFAVQQELWELSLLASVIAFAFLLVDGFHGWLYAEALKHARAIERLLSTYYDALSRGEDDEDAVFDFRRELRAQRLGLFLSFRNRFRLLDVWNARPSIFYRFLYPTLIVIALAASIAIDRGALNSDEVVQPTRVIIEGNKR